MAAETEAETVDSLGRAKALVKPCRPAKARTRSDGYGWTEGWTRRCALVCLSLPAVCTLILKLQATKRLMSDTNGFSPTWARKKWRVLPKRPSSRARKWRTVVAQRRLCTRHRFASSRLISLLQHFITF